MQIGAQMGAMFDAVTDWGNLWQAHRLAARGKRRRASAAGFELALADRLIDLQQDLRRQTYQPGDYCHFFIREPKLRRISAAPFRDRVVHHALCRVIEPVFERHFSPHSHANRAGLGTHLAVDRVQQAAGQFRYVLRADVVQHFASLDHQVLRTALARWLPDPQVLWLVDAILASGHDGSLPEPTPRYFAGDDLFAALRPRGLPIGNLTSQVWSNVYLNDLDWFVQRELRCGAYLRYVDDFVLFDDDKAKLWRCKQALIDRLAGLRLRIHEAQTQVLPTHCGIPWLGFVVYPQRRRLKRRNAVNFTRRLVRNIDAYQAGHISFAELDASVQGWINHVRYADTWRLREHLFAAHPIRGGVGCGGC